MSFRDLVPSTVVVVASARLLVPDRDGLRFMPARSVFRADIHIALVAIRSQWVSGALQAHSWMVMEKPKLSGNGRLRSNNQDRRFESILLRQPVLDFRYSLER